MTQHTGKTGNGPLFSVKETLLAKGSADSLFQQSLMDAKDFIDGHSVPDILDHAFREEKNRRQVLASVHGFVHAGFLFPHKPPADMPGLSRKAGFVSDFSTAASAVVSRELGHLAGGPPIPTAIFFAKLGKREEQASSVEVFFPQVKAARLETWIADEVGTHVGFVLEDPAAFASVQAAFFDEGFQVAPFMAGRPIENPAIHASIIYYEKPCATGKLRLEIFFSHG